MRHFCGRLLQNIRVGHSWKTLWRDTFVNARDPAEALLLGRHHSGETLLQDPFVKGMWQVLQNKKQVLQRRDACNAICTYGLLRVAVQMRLTKYLWPEGVQCTCRAQYIKDSFTSPKS
jgi:hypothetical protein